MQKTLSTDIPNITESLDCRSVDYCDRLGADPGCKMRGGANHEGIGNELAKLMPKVLLGDIVRGDPSHWRGRGRGRPGSPGNFQNFCAFYCNLAS